MNKIDYILKAVCSVTDVTEKMVLSRSRKRHVVNSKKLFCYVAFEEGYSYGQIADHLGLDRTTVLVHRREINIHANIYSDTKQLIKEIYETMKGITIVRLTFTESDVKGFLFSNGYSIYTKVTTEVVSQYHNRVDFDDKIVEYVCVDGREMEVNEAFTFLLKQKILTS